MPEQVYETIGGVDFTPDSTDAAGTFATLILTDLPIEDPEIVGQVWNDSGTLKISAGA